MGHFVSLARGRSVRSPNVHFLLICYGAFRKPRAGALGSLTECPLDIRPYGVCELIPYPLPLTINEMQGVEGLHFVDVLLAFRKPRAGALGSLTECPLDIRSYGVRELTSTPPLLYSPIKYIARLPFPLAAISPRASQVKMSLMIA